MHDTAGKPRIVMLVSHVQMGRVPSRLALAIEDTCRCYAEAADVSVIERPFEHSLEAVRLLDRSQRVDVLVCAGATGAYLRKNLARPVVLMRPHGLDLLRALAASRPFAANVGVLNYRGVIDELRTLHNVLNLEVCQRTYTTLDEAKTQVADLAAHGCKVIIGSSMVTEIAEDTGLVGLLSLGTAAIRQAMDDAIALYRNTRRETMRRRRLDAILEHLRDGVLAVDRTGHVQSLNPAMAALLGVSAEAVLGRPVDDLIARSGLTDVLRTRRPSSDRMLQLGGRSVVATVVPLIEDERLEGALLTLQEAEAVQRADRHIRVKARRSGFAARHELHGIVGESAPMRRVVEMARRYAASTSTVLITGESGTGKELVAQGIHNASARRTRAFVALNCGAFPDTLLESELFGHEDGAFTGARRGGKPGLFEAAHTGTLFLDEIGDMPLALQTRLLRVLQEREVLRLGGTEPTPVDVRVIAATHRDLKRDVAQGRFRADLYYRLNVLRLSLPALRERGEDVGLLAGAIADRLDLAEPDSRRLLRQLMPRLLAYDWPGNVRELENVVERALLWWSHAPDPERRDPAALAAAIPELFDGIAISTALEPAVDLAIAEVDLPRHELRLVGKTAEIAHARAVVAECGGNLLSAAGRLGVSRSTLWRLLRADAGVSSPRRAAACARAES